MMPAVLGAAIFAACSMAGCAAERPATTTAPSQAEWVEARDWLRRLRATEPRAPFVENVAVTMREPRSGRVFHARGAVAVDPHHALRMMLIGPGGMTALDVWATRDAWRLEIPAVGILRRGQREADPALPIGFFRWWFLTPLDGKLLTTFDRTTACDASGGGVDTLERRAFVLRSDDATIELVDGQHGGWHHVRAVRRTEGGVDRLEWTGAELTPRAGDQATYEQPRSGLRVEVLIESMSREPPDALAFVDPDQAPAAASGGPPDPGTASGGLEGGAP
jgi:hypothetical protein